MTESNTPKITSTSAATDVASFLEDLGGGTFNHMLSIALSQVAAAAIDKDKSGKVSIDFSFKRIPGTSQVHCEHTLKFTRPTESGEASEKDQRTTPLHVGKFGRLTLAPENQMSMFDRQGTPS